MQTCATCGAKHAEQNVVESVAVGSLAHVHSCFYSASPFSCCLAPDPLQVAYERALEVFELVEDTDKVVKVLINLANMCELQVRTTAREGWQ